MKNFNFTEENSEIKFGFTTLKIIFFTPLVKVDASWEGPFKGDIILCLIPPWLKLVCSSGFGDLPVPEIGEVVTNSGVGGDLNARRTYTVSPILTCRFSRIKLT